MNAMKRCVRAGLLTGLLLAMLQPLVVQARSWTDAEIGSQLTAMQLTRNRAQISQIITWGQDGPEGRYLQQYLWERLAEAGPHELTDTYARSVLDNPASAPFMRFGALGYLAYAPQEWMKPYASAAITHSHPAVKSMGFFLAAQLGMAEHVAANDAFCSSYNGELSEYALMGLAMSQTMESLYSRFNGSAEDDALATAMGVAKFRLMTDAERAEKGNAFLQSGDPELASYVLQQILRTGHVDWLQQWQVLGAYQNGSSGYEIAFMDVWVEIFARSLGYAFTATATGVPLVSELERNLP